MENVHAMMQRIYSRPTPPTKAIISLKLITTSFAFHPKKTVFRTTTKLMNQEMLPLKTKQKEGWFCICIPRSNYKGDSKMDSRAAAANHVYEDFEPSTELIQEKDCDTILFNLPDFRKDQLRVQLTTSNILRITGSRLISDNKWRRFRKEFPVSANSNIQQISAKFEGGKLYIRLPKLIVQEDKQETNLSPPKKPADELPPPQKSTTTPQEQDANDKYAPKGDPSKPSAAQDDIASIKKEPSTIKTAKEPHDADTGNHDGTENTTGIAKDEHENDSEKAMNKDPRVADKVGERGDEARTQKYKNAASNVAAKLKMPRRLTNAVLVGILAVSLGIYITKLIKSCKIDVNCV